MAETFDLLGELPASQVRIRLRGPFEGREVVWDATLRTLRSVWQGHTGCDGRAGTVLRPFIAVDPSAYDMIPVTVALDLAVIDLPATRKVAIMLRQYRALRRGHHEFGPPRRFARELPQDPGAT